VRVSWRWMSGCGRGDGDKVLAWVPSADRFELVLDRDRDEARSQCDDADDAPAAEDARANARRAAAARRIHRRGLRAFARGDLERAEKLWRSIRDRSIEAENDLGFLLAKTGREPEAERVLLGVIAREPARAVAWLNLGDLEWAQGRTDLARRAYQQYSQHARGKQPARVKRRSRAP
jgi:tetratricopeptide (TPR) repeat protein